jgi:hypothetical protein
VDDRGDIAGKSEEIRGSENVAKERMELKSG